MLSNHVTNLELSQQLAKLGVKQETIFWWGTESEQEPRICTDLNHYDDENSNIICSAFLSSELGEMLPPAIVMDKYENPLHLACFSSGESYSVQLLDVDKYERVKWFDAKTEADCRAKMLIYLIENSHLSVDEVNSNL